MPALPAPPQACGVEAVIDALWGNGGCGACIVSAKDELVPKALLREARDEVDALLRAGALTPGTTSNPRLSHRRGDMVLNYHPDAACTTGGCVSCASAMVKGRKALQTVEASLAALGHALSAELAARGRVRDSLHHTQTQVALFAGSSDASTATTAAADATTSRSAGFLRHTDVTPTSPRRILTLIAYLNRPRWPREAGGQLRVFAPPLSSGDAIAEVLPAGGTVVAMRSSVEHEVVAATTARAALACWLEGELA